MPSLWAKMRTTLEMIKWEHSIFALPFALTAVLLAANGLPGWSIRWGGFLSPWSRRGRRQWPSIAGPTRIWTQLIHEPKRAPFPPDC